MLFRLIPVIGWLSLCAGVCSAQAIGNPGIIERMVRPDPQGIPTSIALSAFLIDIMEIDDVKGTIKVDYFLRQSWKDPRLADSQFQNPNEKLRLTIDDIWNPGISQINVLDSSVIDTVFRIDAEGNVDFRQRLIDTFKDPLDLRDFPFDSQDFNLEFLSTTYLSEDLVILWDKNRSGNFEKFSLTGWQFQSIEVITNWKSFRIGDLDGGALGGVDIRVNLKRRFAFYVWKIFVPLGLIAFMAWTVFWIDPANFGGQIAISTSSVITLIAFQLSLSDLMPRISYLTKIDMFSLGTSFFVFLSLGEAILTSRLAKMERHELALKIDRWMRVIFPLIYSGLIVVVFL